MAVLRGTSIYHREAKRSPRPSGTKSSSGMCPEYKVLPPVLLQESMY